MSLPLKPYSEYRDTGVSWLGQVPHHWQTVPGLAVFCERQAKNEGMIEKTVLSLSYGRIVVKPPERLHGLVPESFETYQVVDVGDIVIRPTDLQNDWTSLRVGLARDRGIITSAYMCLRPIQGMTPEYGYLLLHTYDLKKVFYGLGSGLRQNLDFTDLKRLPMLLPPPGEQSQIAAFLNHFDRRINRLISAKRRMIELLNEQKQAIIHRAVTRGLDPSARLKPSGVEWLGDVPQHWEVFRLRSLLRRIDQGVSPQAEARLADDGHWGVLKSGCVNGGVFSEIEHKRLPDDFQFDANLAIAVGDVLVSRACGSPRYVGAVGRVDSLHHRLILSDKIFRLVFRDPRIVDFAVLAMQSPYYRAQVEESISGAGGLANNLPLSALRSFSLALPPVAEAKRITYDLVSRLDRLSAAIVSAERGARLLTEYRARFMADAVTGKLDVRGVELPDLGDDELTEELRCEEECEIEETDMPREDEDADD